MAETLQLFNLFSNRQGVRWVHCARARVTPEVVTEGDTENEALANAEEAIRAALAYRHDHGIAYPIDAIPEVRRVTIAA